MQFLPTTPAFDAHCGDDAIGDLLHYKTKSPLSVILHSLSDPTLAVLIQYQLVTDGHAMTVITAVAWHRMGNSNNNSNNNSNKSTVFKCCSLLMSVILRNDKVRESMLQI